MMNKIAIAATNVNMPPTPKEMILGIVATACVCMMNAVPNICDTAHVANMIMRIIVVCHLVTITMAQIGAAIANIPAMHSMIHGSSSYGDFTCPRF